MKLMSHQQTAAKKLDNGKILYGGVGSGKSITALQYYMDKEKPRDIYVITTAKKRDSLEWEGDAAQFGLGTEVDGTVAGRLTVDSWNNIGKYIDHEDAFFIFDEQRLVGTGAWVKSFYKIAARNRWIMLSATPGDTWLDYAPVFIANNLFKNITQFKREHILYAPYIRYPKVLRYLDVATLEKYRNMVLVEMPYITHTTRIVEEVETSYDVDLFNRAWVDRWHVYEDRPIQDVGELFRVIRKVVGTDPSRIEAIRELLKEHPKMIIFYNFNYELDILRELSDVCDVAEWNGHKKQNLPDSDAWVYLVQYVAGAEGWNCTSTNVITYYTKTYSWKNFEQSQGRIDRLNTEFTGLYYYVLTSDSVIDKAIGKSLANKQLFNERAFAQKVGKKFEA